MPELLEPPRLIWPTTAVRDSYLAGEMADDIAEGRGPDRMQRAQVNFDAYVAEARGIKTRWGVPSTFFWYVSGDQYLGTLVVRHSLTPALLDEGGHIGYHVISTWRRQGHATRMLAAGLVECRRLGLQRALLTCDPDNEPSRRTILANGGVPDGRTRGEDRFWIDL
ncbi:MAG TPA: GNAT family N-acetyltransferase [Micromonosporaceae bacterium]